MYLITFLGGVSSASIGVLEHFRRNRNGLDRTSDMSILEQFVRESIVHAENILRTLRSVDRQLLNAENDFTGGLERSEYSFYLFS